MSPKDDTGFKTALRIAKIHGSWLEEGEDDGVEADVVIEVGSEGDFAGSMPWTPSAGLGSVPIPPYLNRDAVASDDTTYQTVYADKQGAWQQAAGLHFSDAMMNELRSGEHVVSDVTLHVGAGTFKPVVTSIDDHEMHRETFEITKKALSGIIASLANSVPVVPVGTTSVRVLESLYWMGARNILQSDKCYDGASGTLMLGQWEQRRSGGVHCGAARPSAPSACARITTMGRVSGCRWGAPAARQHGDMHRRGVHVQIIDGLVTNFHQSQSTLMHLTAAVLGSKKHCFAGVRTRDSGGVSIFIVWRRMP